MIEQTGQPDRREQRFLNQVQWRRQVTLDDSAEPRQARLCAIAAELSGRSIRLDEPFALRALAINPLEQKNHERLRTRTASRAYRNFSAQLCRVMQAKVQNNKNVVERVK